MSDILNEAEDGYTTGTMKRCEALLRKHAPRLMKQGGFLKDGLPKQSNYLSDSKKLCIVTMYDNGKSHKEIAKLMNCGTATVDRVLHAHRNPPP